MWKPTSLAQLAAVGLAAGLVGCADPDTAPDKPPVPALNVTTAVTRPEGDGPYAATAEVLAGSSCSLGKRGDMKANLYWQVSGDTPVKSFLLWLERADGSERQLTRKVLGSPRYNGVAAGFEYEKYGPWVRARLELYEGAPDYPAPKTTIYVDCGK